MGCEMATALPGATLDGSTLFAHNSNRPADEGQALFWLAGRDHAVGESVRVGRLTLPQVRRTCTPCSALGAAGGWGCVHGVNEHGVAMGATPTHTRLRGEAPGLTGADLVRLTLERSFGGQAGGADRGRPHQPPRPRPLRGLPGRTTTTTTPS